MFTYLLYNKKTGNPIHVHIDEEGGLSADKFFEFVSPDIDRKDVVFVPLKQGENTDRFPAFDINAQQIRPNVFLDKDSDSAGGSIQSIDE